MYPSGPEIQALFHDLRFRGEQQLDVREIGGDGHLGIRLEAGDEFHGLADPFAGGGVVGDLEAFVADLGKGAANDFDAKRLRGLDGPKAGTIEVTGDQDAVVGTFDGVGDGLSGDGGAHFAAAWMVAAIKSSLVQGRAASWMATICAAGSRASRPCQTESWRSLPPGTNRQRFVKPNSAAISR